MSKITDAGIEKTARQLYEGQRAQGSAITFEQALSRVQKAARVHDQKQSK